MNSYTGTPVNTVWFCAALSIALGLLVFAGAQAINAVFALSVVGAYFAYSIPIIVRFTGGQTFKPGPFYLGAFSFPVAFMSVAFMGFMSVVFLFPTSPGPAVADMNYTVAVFGGVMVLALIYYYFPKYGGVHWFTGPINNIDIKIASPKTSSDTPSLEDMKKGSGQVDTAQVE
jgi:hypothetical protein